MPPAAVMLRVAEVTEYQEQILRKSAALDAQKRDEEGLNFGRQQMEMSVDILLKNTKLGGLQGCAQPTLTLAGVRRVAESGEGTLTPAGCS